MKRWIYLQWNYSCLGDFSHVGKGEEEFEGIQNGWRNIEGDDARVLRQKGSMLQTWFQKKEEHKVTFSSGGNTTQMIFL